ncbi:MAG: 4Fe-4S dicluster domain-containing protein [Rhodomicrobium sp.]
MPSLKIGHRHVKQGRDAGGSGVRRREALQLLAANMALIAAGCSKPDEEIVPYVTMPERLIPGIPLRFATALPLAGYGRGAIVTSYEGRPTKIEGNPLHPASLGSTDVFAEAEIFNLYDPSRAQAPVQESEIRAWEDFFTAWQPAADGHRQDKGAGLVLLTGRITSPTLLRQIKALQAQFPAMAWHAYEPLDSGAAQSAKLAFNRPLDILPRIGDADVILSLDSRFLDAGPQQIALSRAFADKRRVRLGTKEMLRLYAVEAAPTLTGANADHALAVTPSEIGHLACAIALRLGAGAVPNPALSEELSRLADAVLADLNAHQGRALVLGGPTLSPDVQALVHWINAKLGAPVTYIDPVAGSDAQPGLRELVEKLRAGQVKTLATLECNPVYDGPADLSFATALEKAPFRVHFGLWENETSALCDWQLPASHPLESWSDLRGPDGKASIVQPLIEPLYDTRTAHEFLAMLGGNLSPSSYRIVKETWRAQGNADGFEDRWRKSLEDGVIEGTAAQPVNAGEPTLPEIKLAPQASAISLVLQADPCVWDGRYAANPWLQECPKPFTKQVWGNALALNEATAHKAGLRDGDRVRIVRETNNTEALILVQKGLADGVASLTLGYGRWKAGTIGSDLGTNGFALRESTSPWVLDGVKIEGVPSGNGPAFATAVTKLDAATEDLYPILSLAAAPSAKFAGNREHHPSLLPEVMELAPAWAMVIDNTACIGCNACVIACQAENSVPVVGPEEILEGRVMHWLRIDYYEGKSAPPGHLPARGFEPVPCMHCEKAPCEPVCPVEASVHDSQGLNVQVYNRCIGTRFCEANCPYKVRRFNFFGYASGQEYKNLGAEVLRAQKNPEVTVRARGVMEKCTYCIQRIARATHMAAKENQDIPEGAVVTACEAACPTRAISFGDLTKSGSEVSRLRQEPQHYALLGHLGTQPRTTYLAKVTNPNPAFQQVSEHDAG